MALRAETRARARALQMLYAWDMQGCPSMETVGRELPDDGKLKQRERERAERLATAVAGAQPALDREIAACTENWRFERIGAVERNILRLGLHEILRADIPAPVAIDEAVKLARWFAGPKAPGFVNGVLDALARRLGRL